MKNVFGLLFILFLFLSCAPSTNTVLWQDSIIDRAVLIVDNLLIDPDRGERISDYLANAKGVYISVDKFSVGLGLGFEGGTGLLLVKGKKGRWSSPAFMSTGGASFGLQIGALKESSMALFLTNKSLLSAIQSGGYRVGAAFKGAVGDKGSTASTEVSTSTENDVVVFGEASGAFVGGALGVSGLSFDQKLNDKFYNSEDTTLEGIVLEGVAFNKSASPLIDKLNYLTGE